MTSARQIYLGSRRGPALPYDSEVEYIESTGTQWINTGLKSYNSSTAASLKRARFSGRLAPMRSSGYMYHGWNGWGFWGAQGGKWRGSSISYVVGQFYDVEVVYTPSTSTCGMWVDGTKVWTDSRPGNANAYGVGLFCIGDANGTVTGSYANTSIWRMGHMYVESKGEVRDMIPVRFTNEQGVSEGAMYDRVSGQLFRNSGTGAFSFGTDIAGGGV